MQDLYTFWRKTAVGYSDNPELAEKLWEEIEAAYQAKGRYYHNLSHLQFMLQLTAEIEGMINDRDAFIFSIFYHDIVYNVKRQDNEQQSAILAAARLEELSVPAEKIQHCCSMIIATKSHLLQGDNDTNYLLDTDLAILGQDAATYQAYTRQIRKEYAIYPGFLYRQGRKKVLKHLLEQESIYKTHYFYDRYEKQARINLQSELDRL